MIWGSVPCQFLPQPGSFRRSGSQILKTICEQKIVSGQASDTTSNWIIIIPYDKQNILNHFLRFAIDELTILAESLIASALKTVGATQGR